LKIPARDKNLTGTTLRDKNARALNAAFYMTERAFIRETLLRGYPESPMTLKIWDETGAMSPWFHQDTDISG
jgi:hypothetical protein